MYAAVTETNIVTEDIKNITDAALVDGCNIVVAYSLGASPADLNEDISLHGKTLILSNVKLNGNVESKDFFLLGSAEVNPTDSGYFFTGTSSEGTPKEALTSASLEDIPALMNAVEGAQVKYTVTGAVGFDRNLEVYDMVIGDDASFAINAPSEGDPNRLCVRHSLAVNGAGRLTAAPLQRLELWDSASVSGLNFYETDGTTEYTLPAEYEHLEFEWSGSAWTIMGAWPADSAGSSSGRALVLSGLWIKER